MNVISLINRMSEAQLFTIINRETSEIILKGYTSDFDNLQSCVDYDFRKLLVYNVYCDKNTIQIIAGE